MGYQEKRQRCYGNIRPYWYKKTLSTTLRSWLLLLLPTALFTSCGETILPLKDVGPHTHLVYVSSNSWHTAIVVPVPAIIATNTFLETAHFPDAAFLEFGWGDRIYYPAKEKTFEMALIAALIPTPAVMHIAALQVPPKDDGSGLKTIPVKLTESGFQRFIQTLSAELERPSDGHSKPISRGLYSDSYFYHARGKFHLFNTCNTWTARMLLLGGVPLSPSKITTADELMNQLQKALAAE